MSVAAETTVGTVSRVEGDSPRPNLPVLSLAALLLAGGAALIATAHGWRLGALYLVGGGLGLVLYHAAFGFTGAWRVFLRDGRSAGLRAQMLMLGLATVVILPLLADGDVLGRSVGGAVAPFGLAVGFGAFLFGIGMQLGGGCASGTLFAVGAGNARMVVTLAAFILGSVAATRHLPWWLETPSLGRLSLLDAFGLAPALGIQLALIAAIAWLALWIERRRTPPPLGGEDAPRAPPSPFNERLLRGPWPLWWGAIGLALLAALTVALAGHPWSVTFGFSLWGAKILGALGLDVASWAFWTWPYPKAALEASILAETTSVMDFGIIIGAMLAAGAAGRFGRLGRLPYRSFLAAVIGGLLMGYGARLAFGCNIGAFFGGVVSASLHGWLWFVAAMAGCTIGVRLRPAFGLGR